MKHVARRTLVVVLVIVALLVAARVALPYVVKDYLNRKMDHMGAYHGHVADVDIHLWRGAYSLADLRIDKVEGKVPVPFFSAATTDIAISWRALTHGTVRGRVEFDRASLNFVDGGDKATGQSGKGVDWRQQLEGLLPIRLDEVTVHNSQVTFHNFVSHPKVDMKMTDVEATAVNLSNADRSEGRRVADFDATAKVLGDAPLMAKASFDPLDAKLLDFTFVLRIRDIQLKRLNDLARAYAKLDFAAGQGTFVMQLEAHNGELNGYAKPLLHDVQIFSWKQDVEEEGKNPLQVAWEALANGVTWLFKNHEKDQFATKVPISGRIDNKDIGTWQAVVNVLHNAFVQAYTPKLEDLKPAPEKKH
ncbi:DUF748 domain-containing protein [Frateuria terrea]|uniref:DUF748 domain-containing protein n=1 Tax=Frateuria terrea TaxID=529704 RepID=A0A1H6SGV8_9GAMM|nr:DUF748 domain-containing protein [Frateuria terrea]SEI66136.1 protein of unknown function [Frateuria terrea]SFP25714.1 protein of unknown function [Frateuria terrea]